MAKKYNHRRAEDEYKKMKKKDEKFMRENGMPEWTISRRISELIKTYKFFKSNT